MRIPFDASPSSGTVSCLHICSLWKSRFGTACSCCAVRSTGIAPTVSAPGHTMVSGFFCSKDGWVYVDGQNEPGLAICHHQRHLAPKGPLYCLQKDKYCCTWLQLILSPLCKSSTYVIDPFEVYREWVFCNKNGCSAALRLRGTRFVLHRAGSCFGETLVLHALLY